MFKQFLADHSRKNALLKETFRLIHKHRHISKAELIESLQVKPTTMTRTIEELLEKGWIKEGGLGPSSGGRPPILYEADRSTAYIIGIDISRAAVRMVLTDMAFRILENHMITMTVSHSPEIVCQEVNSVIEAWLGKYQLSANQLLGIGVGAVGPILRKEGRIIQPESFLSAGWEDVDIPAQLSRFSVPVLVDNGANSAALAEYIQHKEVYPNILYCIHGYGIRGGVINNGKVFYSGQGDTTALGHMIIQAGGKVCVCGKEGCWTAYSSYPAILDEYKRAGGGKEPSIEEFLVSANSGDPLSRRITKKAAFYFGVGLANAINALRPELVVLHGTLIYQHPLFYEEAVGQAKAHIYTPDGSAPIFKKGFLKEESIALGAAMQVFESYYQEGLL